MQNECYTCLLNGHLLLIEFNNMKRLIIMISITVAKVTKFHLVFYYKCCNSDWIFCDNIIMLNFFCAVKVHAIYKVNKGLEIGITSVSF